MPGISLAFNLRNSAQWTWGTLGSLGPARTTVIVAEPALSVSKTAAPAAISIGSEVTITLTIQHTAASKTDAYDVVLSDVLPAEVQYVPGSLECTSGAQDADVACSEGNNTITAQWSNFALTGGNGRITFRVTILSIPQAGITNTANVLWTSLPGDVSGAQNSNAFSKERNFDPASQVDIYGARDSLVLGSSSAGNGTGRNGRVLPETGFAPGVVTDLSQTPHEVYLTMDEVDLEIPALGINIPVVGVPQKDGAWNVSWLANQAGWLGGTAFPSWNGNSVLTSHVYLSNGLPVPFVNLNKLKFGDKLIIHAYGEKYTFEVQVNKVVEPNDTSAFNHEQKPWLTLITCKEYDEKSNAYLQRVVVKAVMVKSTAE